MKNTKEVEELAKKLKNKQAKEWREKNKKKVKEINRNYWLRKAKKLLDKGGDENEPRN